MSGGVRTTAELDAALRALPPFSAAVYEAIQAWLYAEEPSFSDLDVADVAKALGCARKAVNASVGHLVAVGLVWTDTNERGTVLLTYEHSKQLARTVAR